MSRSELPGRQRCGRMVEVSPPIRITLNIPEKLSIQHKLVSTKLVPRFGLRQTANRVPTKRQGPELQGSELQGSERQGDGGCGAAPMACAVNLGIVSQIDSSQERPLPRAAAGGSPRCGCNKIWKNLFPRRQRACRW